ncbi:hypothetical protein ACFY4C_41010 [Actinomadura viridis]|uniref:hypothetical protein n=1 Tax=Actinomadura viridis TaxID=58110 RepID=UPI0036754EA5
MALALEVPRVLRLTYEIRVPQGLRANVRSAQIDKAVDRITGSVQGAVETVFPWADEMSVRSEWLYAWRDDTERVALVKTEQNTVEQRGAVEQTADGDASDAA